MKGTLCKSQVAPILETTVEMTVQEMQREFPKDQCPDCLKNSEPEKGYQWAIAVRHCWHIIQ